MAAPCSRMASRPLWQFITNVRRTGLKHTGVRQISLGSACRAATQTRSKTESVASPWKLYGAVCLQRLPVISQERNPIEDQFAELMHQVNVFPFTCQWLQSLVNSLRWFADRGPEVDVQANAGLCFKPCTNTYSTNQLPILH